MVYGRSHTLLFDCAISFVNNDEPISNLREALVTNQVLVAQRSADELTVSIV